MSFGRMPIANGFLREEDFVDEFFFELCVGFCQHCTLVQLTHVVDPDKLFHGGYAYLSSISVRMADHFRLFADDVCRKHLGGNGGFVVEIGSNDGIMLQHFATRGLRHLGVEPSSNVAEVARQKGISTLCEFFGETTAQAIVSEYGQADVILGANVVCHLPNIHSVLRGVDVLLKKDGVFIFEEPYLGDILDKVAYDQIYDEHVFYFSGSSGFFVGDWMTTVRCGSSWATRSVCQGAVGAVCASTVPSASTRPGRCAKMAPEEGGSYARCRPVPPGAGAGSALDGDPRRPVGDGGTRGCVGRARGPRPLALSDVWERAARLRPRGRTGVAPPRHLSMRDLPARAAPAGRLPGPWRAAGAPAVGRVPRALHAAV